MTLIVSNVGGIITIMLGVMRLLAPDKAAAFTSLSPIEPTGLSEIRATYGGFALV